MPAAAYVKARHQQPRRGEIRVVVVHCTISPEQGTGAEAVARYFQTVDRPASSHLVADNNSVVRCVADNMEAVGAAGANRDGLHLELVGYADQSAEQWMDAYGRAMFAQAGPFMREWSALYDIPPRWLSVAQVADGQSRGFCTHADVSKAFPAVSTGHTDPGKQFPKQAVMGLWFPQSAPIPPMEDDAMFTYEYDAAGAAPNVLVLVACGKQVRITNNGVLERRRKASDSHLGPVDKSEFDAFTKAYGAVAGL